VPSCRGRLEHVFDEGQHGVLIESVSAQVGVLPRPDLQLARTNAFSTSMPAPASRFRWSSRRSGSTMWKARSPPSKPSLMNE